MGCTQSSSSIPRKSLRSRFEPGDLLGKGAFSEVRKATKKGSEEQYALKMVFLAADKTSISSLEKEVSVMRSLDHPKVIRLEDAFQDSSAIYLVQELAMGGDLAERVFDESCSLTEDDARFIARQIFEAVEYLHSRGVCHRDLKPGNVLMVSSDPASSSFNHIKIADFGLSSSQSFDYSRTMSTQCGTPDFSAPELLQGADGSKNRIKPYSCKVDVWSVGAIVYSLLGRRPPFAYAQGNTPLLIEKVREGAVKFPSKIWKDISPTAVELIENMMCVDPEARPAIRDARKLEWICEVRDQS